MTDSVGSARTDQTSAPKRVVLPPYVVLWTAVTRFWIMILLAGVAAGGVGWLYASGRPDQYEATASIYFRNYSPACQALGTCSAPGGDADRRSATQIDQLKLPSVSTRAAQAMGGSWTTRDVQSSFEVAQAGQSDIVEVTVTRENPEETALIANALVEAAVSFRADNARRESTEALRAVNRRLARMDSAERAGAPGQELRQRQSQLRLEVAAPGGDAQVAQRARVPVASVTPSPVRLTGLATILGLLIGSALAVARTLLSPRVVSPVELRAVWPGTPVLATLPKDRVLAKASYKNASSASLAPLLIARSSLRYVADGADAKVVGITSSVAGEGKTTVAYAMAAAAAAEGTRVLLIEADLRAPSLKKNFNVPDSPGLAGFLRADEALESSVRHIEPAPGLGFDLLPAGEVVPSPLPILRSERMAALLQQSRAQYDFVVVDLPPVTLVPDGLAIAPHLDGFVPVVRMRYVTPVDLERLRDLLGEVSADGAPTLGLIVNQSRGSVPVAYGGNGSGSGRSA